MKLYAAIVTYVPDIVEKRAPYRPAHLAYLEGLRARGNVIMAGAWADPIDGALIIYRAASREEVEAMLDNDPYCQAGLWTSRTVREWNVVVGAPA
ncbi:MAG: YciI family protein [Chloroflexota bacterium]|nr:YciI family protein [Dehalococcoidia bacterium]MDW8252417.1 YciI family protein [Chloroflexota bacterium]